VIPPLPRYLYKGCCPDKGHCTNIGSQGHASRLLSATIKLRGVLKKKLGAGTVSNCWVMDTCCMTPDPDSKSQGEKLDSLHLVGATDGVHFTPDGYASIAKNICETIVRLQAGHLGKSPMSADTAGDYVSGTGARHFWRGFSSPVGSATTCKIPGWLKDSRMGMGRGRVPYQRNYPRWGKKST
jgi:hypothetical protein